MKKAINVLSIVSMSIYALTFLSVIIVIVFQEDLAHLLNSDAEWYVFTIPYPHLFISISMLILSIVAFVFSLYGKSPVWANVLIVALSVFVPILTSIVSRNYAIRSINPYGEYAIASYSIVSSLVSKVMYFNVFALSSYYVSAGMRIAMKNK